MLIWHMISNKHLGRKKSDITAGKIEKSIILRFFMRKLFLQMLTS